MFYRTAAGEFFLQALRSDPDIPEAYKRIYLAPPRRKELKRDWALAVELNEEPISLGSRAVPVSTIHAALNSGLYAYLPYNELAAKSSAVRVYSFVVVFRNGELLSFKSGKFFHRSDPLYGTRSIGVGGAVFADDIDILFESMFGIISNGIRELSYGVGLSRRLAEEARYGNEVKPVVGVETRKSPNSPPILHVVLAYECPAEFSPTKTALSVNDLRWIDGFNPGNSLEDYDATSRFLFSSGYVERIIRSSTEA